MSSTNSLAGKVALVTGAARRIGAAITTQLHRSGADVAIHCRASVKEAAALAARDIGFHVMGYFPITPSTEVAENLSQMQANGDREGFENTCQVLIAG